MIQNLIQKQIQKKIKVTIAKKQHLQRFKEKKKN